LASAGSKAVPHGAYTILIVVGGDQRIVSERTRKPCHPTRAPPDGAAREWFAENRHQDYLYLHRLSVWMAEPFAEYLHKRIRGALGFAAKEARDPDTMLAQGHRSSRYSFDYPACSNLADRKQLLRPSVTLREGLATPIQPAAVGLRPAGRSGGLRDVPGARRSQPRRSLGRRS
jgi:hypothetical protein